MAFMKDDKRNGGREVVVRPKNRELNGEAVIEHCESAAQVILAVSDEVQSKAQSFADLSNELANNLRKCAELEKQRTARFYGLITDAERTITAVSKSFSEAALPGEPAAKEDLDVRQGLEAALRTIKASPQEPDANA